MPMLKQISEINKNVLPDYYNEPGFFKMVERKPSRKI